MVKRKGKKSGGGQRAVFKKALGHSAVIMADLSKMALVCFIHMFLASGILGNLAFLDF